MNLAERLGQPFRSGEPLSIEEVAGLVPRPRTSIVRLEADEDVGRHQWGSRVLLAAAAACLVAVCYALVGTSAPTDDVETSPASGATTLSGLSRARSWMCGNKTGVAYKLSTGMLKKP